MTHKRRGFLAGLLSLPLLNLVPTRLFPAETRMAFVKGELPFVEMPRCTAEQVAQHRRLAVEAIANKAMELREVVDLSTVAVKTGVYDLAYYEANIGDALTQWDGVEYAWMRISHWFGVTENPFKSGTEYHFLTRTLLSGGHVLRECGVATHPRIETDTMIKRNPDNGLIPVCAVIA
jgi:hypothetical protein